MSDDASPGKLGVHFDKTINLGHILTFLGFLIAGLGAWASIDKRLTVGEEYRMFQRQIDSQQDQRALDQFLQMKELLARLDTQVERIAVRLDKVPPRTN